MKFPAFVVLFLTLTLSVSACIFEKASPLPTATSVPTIAPPTATPPPTQTPEPTATPLPKIYGNFNGSISSPYGYPIVPLDRTMVLTFGVSNNNDSPMAFQIVLKGPLSGLGMFNRTGPIVPSGDSYALSTASVEPGSATESVIWLQPTALGHVDLTASLLTQDQIPVLDANDNPQVLSFTFQVR